MHTTSAKRCCRWHSARIWNAFHSHMHPEEARLFHWENTCRQDSVGEDHGLQAEALVVSGASIRQRFGMHTLPLLDAMHFRMQYDSCPLCAIASATLVRVLHRVCAHRCVNRIVYWSPGGHIRCASLAGDTLFVVPCLPAATTQEPCAAPVPAARLQTPGWAFEQEPLTSLVSTRPCQRCPERPVQKRAACCQQWRG